MAEMVKPLTADQWVRGLYMALLGRLPDRKALPTIVMRCLPGV